MKLVTLQYLRAIAALIVVLAHSIQYVLQWEAFEILKIGRLGVVLFFVISGFVMVFISGDRQFSPVEFFEKRLMRIVPLYWIATTGVAVMALLLPSLFRNTEFSLEHYVLSLLFIPHVDSHGDTSPMLSLGWTLNFEMFFYLVFALMGPLRGKARLILLTVVFVSLMIIGGIFSPRSQILATYTSYFLMPFLMGAWLGWLFHLGRIKPISPPLGILLTSVALLSLPAAWLIEYGSRGAALTVAVMSSWSVFAIWLAVASERWSPRSSFLLLAGDGSYSIYLVHMYAVGFVAAMLRWMGLPSHYWLVGILCAFVVGTTVGLISYLLIEKPFIGFARTVHAWRRPAKSAAV